MFDCSGFGALDQIPEEEEDVSGTLGSPGAPGDRAAPMPTPSLTRASRVTLAGAGRGAQRGVLYDLCNFFCRSKIIPN